MKYCKTTTQAHNLYRSYSSAHIKMCDVVTREGGHGRLFSNDEVLDLDAIEELLARHDRRNKRNTMDITFGYSEQNGNGRINNKCMWLVDFKYRVANVLNLKKTELEDKVNGSIGIIGREIPIHKGYYFVFKKGIKAQAEYRIAKLFSNKRIYQAIDDDKLLEMM